jgi:hypothetical protein
MLPITIIFALLVAVWGFPGAIATLAKQRAAHATPRPQPAPADEAVSQPRGTRPTAPAGHG